MTSLTALSLRLPCRFVYKQLLKQLQFKRVASLTEDGQKYSEYISLLHDMLQASGVTFVSNRKFPTDTTNMAPVGAEAGQALGQ